ncbi:MAG TPA: hypothetical protein DEP36_08815 [Gammaproteobacteria bacterium]|nr:hypothetical protein [Gammaproteobacteria bacterium]HRF45371.1 hypothetical protein [Candidatus Competibacteraceae bacterium]
MTLTLLLGSDPERVYPVLSVSGFHRPLNDEASNLTATLAGTPYERRDLADPLLGAAAQVYADDTLLMTGILQSVTWSAQEIIVRIES